MSRELQVIAPSGYDPAIAPWIWAMEEARRRTLALVSGLDQRTLDWQGPDGLENAIGSLLYHIALVEMSWLFLDVQLQEFPAEVKADFPYEMATGGRVTPVRNVPLAVHLNRLSRSREVFLNAFRGMPVEEWHRLRTPDATSYSVTPAWAMFHLLEHEAGHAAQISALKTRAARHFGD